MRPNINGLLAIMLGFGLACPAAAQISQDPATGRITCTTEPGRFARRIVTGVGEGGRISGMIRMVSPDPSPRFTAAGGFIFKEAGARNAGVHIALRPETTDRIVIGLHLPGEPFLELAEVRANLWIPLSLSYVDGMMTVTVGQQERAVRRRVRLTGPVQPILHCNSGTFEFRLGSGLGMGEAPVNDR